LSVKPVTFLPYYSIAKIFVLNSYYLEGDNDFEGLGLVLLEAQSLGIPVIGANSGGIPEAIHDGFSGYIIPTQDPDTLAHKINQFKNDHNLYQKFSQGAKKFLCKKNLILKKTLKNILIIYKQ